MLARTIMAAPAVLALSILGWLSWDAYHDLRHAEAQLPTIARMEVARADIVHLDEVLTMSARMAAATGDLAWEQRYLRFEPELDRSIKDASRLDPDASQGAAASKTKAANLALVAMELRAFDLVRHGQTVRAQRLLSSEEYENNKTVYATGMAEFNRHLLQASAAMRAELQADTRRSAITTIAAAVLLILGGSFVALAARRWQTAMVNSNLQLQQKTAELAELNNQLDKKVGERTTELSESVHQHQLTAERSEHLAYHDKLTGLANRSMFSKTLEQGLREAQRYKRQLAVFFIDLDRFKNINDTLGHEAGDILLQEMAARLTSCMRGSDSVARLGGDEFVVMAPGVNGTEQLGVVAQKILDSVARSFTLYDHEFHVTASIGISVYPTDGDDERALMKNADIAMYQAKEDGKNTFAFYSAELNKHSVERLAFKKLGIRLSLDDFGTGYSSLSNLKRFPIDTIKVDRSFVRELPANEEDRAITDAVIAMGRTLNMTVVAEGVETQGQIDFLREHACDEVQGFYFSKAVSSAAITALLTAQPWANPQAAGSAWGVGREYADSAFVLAV